MNLQTLLSQIVLALGICLGVVCGVMPSLGVAQEMVVAPENDVSEMEHARRSQTWQTVQDFDETSAFSIAGPPMQENIEHAKAETDLYEAMVNHFEDLEDEDDEYLFVVECLYDADDASRPASLRLDENADETTQDGIGNQEENLSRSSSVYIDSIRPTYFPGFPIKPRSLDQDKKENPEARSLFTDIAKNKADEIMGDDIKPIMGTEPPKMAEKSDASQIAGQNDSGKADLAKKPDVSQKAGNINAPPKQHAISPDEETLGALKQAVKELGMEKRLNLGSNIDGHTTLEHQGQETTQDGSPQTSAIQKKTYSGAKHYKSVKKKPRKTQSRHKKFSKPVPVEPAPPPKEESIFDIF